MSLFFLVAQWSYAQTTNYRSIGTDNTNLFNTGTATGTLGSPNITLSIALPASPCIGQGDQIRINFVNYSILSASGTSIVLQQNFSSASGPYSFAIRRRYNTIQAWENAITGDLTASNTVEIGVIYNDGQFDENVLIVGSTTSATNFIMLTVAPCARHDGTSGVGANLTAASGDVLEIADQYVTLEWLVIKDWGSGSSRKRAINLNKDNIVIRNCILDGGTSPHDTAAGLIVDRDDNKIYNNIIMNLTGATGGQGLESSDLADNCSYANNTIYNCRIGFTVVAGASPLALSTNNLVVGSTATDFVGTFHASSDYNMDSDNTAPGANSINNSTAAANFNSVVLGAEDLHLLYSAPAKETGTDVSGTIGFSNDIDDDTRPLSALWDIGADEAATTNSRSIGTNAGILFNGGTASATNGSPSITLSSTLPGSPCIGEGDMMTIPGQGGPYYISSASGTSITLQSDFTGTTGGPYSYDIKRSYNTIQSWETARQGDMVAANTFEVGVCYNDGDFSTATIIEGSTTDATRYMVLAVAPCARHTGIGNTGAQVNGWISGIDKALQIQDKYFRLEWLEFRRIGMGWQSGALEVELTATNVTIENIIIFDYDSTGLNLLGIDLEESATATIRNSLIYDGDVIGIRVKLFADLTIQNCTIYGMDQRGITVENDATATIQNSTIYNNINDGIRILDNAVVTVTNTISMGNGDDDIVDDSGGSGSLTQSYNLTSDATATGTGSLINKVTADQFVSITAGSEDLHLKLGTDAYNTGTSLSGSFTDDIDGDSRPQLGAWDMGSDESILPLPIKLLYFKAKLIEDQVRLLWSTASETDNDYYSLQRSRNGADFEEFGTVTGAGNSNTILNYVYYDERPYPGFSYYRLKQVDFDGNYTYSPIQVIYLERAKNTIDVYPNPARDLINIYVGIPGDQSLDIVVFNSYGQKMIEKKDQAASEHHILTINTSRLKPGLYIITITNADGAHIERQFIKH